MKLSIKKGSENYAATIVKIDKIFDIEGADRIKKTVVFGNNVVVGTDVTEGSLMVYFCSGTKLSNDYCHYNNLYEDPEKNFDKAKKGYINHKNRVRAVKLRGVISDGILMPISSLQYVYQQIKLVLSEGDTFTDLDEVSICEKYIVPTKNSGGGNRQPKQPKRISRLVENQFYLHNDTDNLRRNIHKISLNDIIGIHYKKHGCLPARQTVNMFDGTTKKIKDIVAGDVVCGFDHKSGKIVPSKVLNTFINGRTDIWYKVEKDCNINDAGKTKRVLLLTGNHEVYIKNRGYTAIENCKVGDTIINNIKELQISELQKYILEGILISDGYLDRHSKKYAIRYGHKKEHEDYLDYIASLLGSICTGHKRTRTSGFGTTMVDMSTKNLFQINQLFNNWIIDGNKEVPDTFILNKYNLAFWYMGDGSLHHHSSQKDRADFAICGFSEKSAHNINKALEEFGFNNFRIYNDSVGRLRLKLNASDAKMLFENICDLVPPVMQYKLPEEYRGKFKNPTTQISNLSWIENECRIKSIKVVSPKEIGGYAKKYDIQTETSNFFASETLVHNSSAVIGNVLVKRELSWFEKLLKRFGVNIVDTEYDIVYSSRKVVKNQYLNPDTGGGFYGEDIWGVVAKEVGHLIPKGWTLYGEVIGFLPSGGYIQKDYDYGCSPESLDEQYKSGHSVYKEKPQHKFYVYKISVVNPDGKVIYLTDKQIEEWCEKVGLLYKDTFIYYGTVDNLFESKDFTDWEVLDNRNTRDTWQETLLDYLEFKYNEKDCYMCTKKVPEEGIVLRLERLESYEAYKLKSKRFLLMESEQQENDVVNLEDNQEE